MLVNHVKVGIHRTVQLSVSFIVMFIFLSTSNIVFAHEKEIYRVDVPSLNVRSEPALQARIVGSLSAQTVVEVQEKKHGWAYVNYSGGKGWVASQYLYQTDEEHSSSSKEVHVNAESVYIRSGPSVNREIIAGSYYGDSLEKIEEEGEWIKVQLENGQVGWIAGWLVSAGDTTSSSELPLQGVNIVLDAGHGGYDPGAVAVNGLLEKRSTIEAVDHIARKLRLSGATVILTRENDRYVSLQNRVRITRSSDPDAFVSVHFNSASSPYAEGISTYFYHDSGKGLARNIQHKLSQEVSLQNDGAQFGNFHVLRENIENSILVELGFLSTSSDLAVIERDGYPDKVARAITDGLIKEFSP
ncbi:N-acetylmuramoyl-L-alanine amidase [Halobacillus litoralis]|uniref:SH3b domain-containing protein n=1 Tax=Halobacillus litoralis TaxID=45668 RepID=A0A410MFI7_9BACI|nr:N-acetylmuramoyl-L-alanine amidase [Halobacillus litoralis]QAS53468.1 hypothetical protein HLI_15305 [Halobacillus litoralis]